MYPLIPTYKQLITLNNKTTEVVVSTEMWLSKLNNCNDACMNDNDRLTAMFMKIPTLEFTRIQKEFSSFMLSELWVGYEKFKRTRQ